MWNYVFFFLYLKLTPQTEYTAQDSYVKNLLNLNDITFFPIQQSGSSADEGESVTQHLELIEYKIEKLNKLIKSLKSSETKKDDKTSTAITESNEL